MRVLRVYSPTPCTPSRGGMVLLVGVLMLFCLGLSGQKVSLFQLRNAPDSTYVIGAGPGGVAKWVKKDSLGLMDSIYINGVWYSDGDTVEITDTYVQFFDGGSLQTITFTTGETIVFDPFTPEYAFLENVGGGYYRLKFTPTVIDTFERVGNKIRLSLASDNEFTKELTLDNTNQLGNLTIEGDSIYYQKCPTCIDSLIGVIVHPITIDSTTVSSTATVTLTEVANVITATVNDGSITPVKLDKAYLYKEGSDNDAKQNLLDVGKIQFNTTSSDTAYLRLNSPHSNVIGTDPYLSVYPGEVPNGGIAPIYRETFSGFDPTGFNERLQADYVHWQGINYRFSEGYEPLVDTSRGGLSINMESYFDELDSTNLGAQEFHIIHYRPLSKEPTALRFFTGRFFEEPGNSGVGFNVGSKTQLHGGVPFYISDESLDQKFTLDWKTHKMSLYDSLYLNMEGIPFNYPIITTPSNEILGLTSAGNVRMVNDLYHFSKVQGALTTTNGELHLGSTALPLTQPVTILTSNARKIRFGTGSNDFGFEDDGTYAYFGTNSVYNALRFANNMSSSSFRFGSNGQLGFSNWFDGYGKIQIWGPHNGIGQGIYNLSTDNDLGLGFTGTVTGTINLFGKAVGNLNATDRVQGTITNGTGTANAASQLNILVPSASGSSGKGLVNFKDLFQFGVSTDSLMIKKSSDKLIGGTMIANVNSTNSFQFGAKFRGSDHGQGSDGQIWGLSSGAMKWIDPSVGTVTSVGLTTDAAGTDVSVSGSPVTGSGTITLSLPNSSASNRGVLTPTDWSYFDSKIGGTGSLYLIPYFTGTNTVAGTPNFKWNNPTNNLEIAGSVSLAQSGANNTIKIGSGAFVNTGFNNIFLGSSSGASNTTGYEGVFIGTGSGQTNVSGNQNVGVGTNTLASNTASGNTAIGNNGLYTNSTGSGNVGIGASSLYLNATGASNTAVGSDAMFRNTASNNTGVGRYAIFNVQNGGNNTAVGYAALYSGTNSTASSNVAAGYRAGANVTGNGNVFLGNQAADGPTSISNQLWIDNSSTSTPLIFGDFAQDTLRVNSTFAVRDLTGTGTSILGSTDGNRLTKLTNGGGVSVPGGVLTIDHGGIGGLGDDDHTQYHNDTRGDVRYYTKTQLNAGQLDNRYYTETEIDASLALKQNNISLTTTGSSGAATFISNVLNIPNYSFTNYWGLSGTSLTPTSSTYNIGVGGSTPYSKMHITGNLGIYNTGGSQIYLGDAAFNNGSNYNIGPGIGAMADAGVGGAAGALAIFTYDGSRTERIRILSDGSVGIGNTSPTTTLDVTGTFKTSGANTLSALATGGASQMVVANTSGVLSTQAITTGTLTSIATNNGITGGTITSTGTIGLTGNALDLHNLASNGLIARTGSGISARTITASTGISVTHGSGVTGNPTITNTAPDQTVSITGAGITNVTGTYPNFTVTSTEVDGSTSNETNVLSLGAKSGSTVPLNSSNSGGTINFIEGSGISLTRSVNDLTIASTATSDGNGIYDGSGSLSGNTTVSQGLNRYYHSTSTSGGVGTDFDIRYDYGYMGTYNGTNISSFKSISGESTITTSVSGITKSYIRSNANSSSMGWDSTYFLAATAVAKLKINNSFGTSGDVLYSGGSGSMYWAAPSGGITGSGTATRLAFWSGTSALSSNANALWDNTNSRLGLGSTPYSRLHLNGDIGAYKTGGSHIYLGDAAFDNSTLFDDGPGIGAMADAGVGGAAGALGLFVYNGARSEKIRILSDGSVGIGTTSPSATLDVNGSFETNNTNIFGALTGASTVLATLSSTGQLGRSASSYHTGSVTTNYLSKATSSYVLGPSIVYDNGTNVGVGTASPSQKLHVTGNALITGTLQVQTNGGTSIAMAGLTSDLKLASLGYSGNLNLSGGVLESKSTDIQTFTSSGTWTKPSGAKTVHIIMHGGGGGGGSGGYVSSTPASGGAGGGGGARTETDFIASLLSGTVSITVGGGGSAGSGVNGGGSDSDGNYGSDGGFSSFGTLARAYGGDGGGPGITLSASVGGAGGPGSFDGGTGGAGGAPGANQGSQAPASKFASMGGNGGAGCSLTTTGSNQNALFAPFGGTPNSANYFGYGGTGGGSGSAAGGAGNTYGAGGGGGAAKTGTTSGSGGAGAAGIVIVITSF